MHGKQQLLQEQILLREGGVQVNDLDVEVSAQVVLGRGNAT